MRVPCQMVAEILAQLTEQVDVGVTTFELESLALAAVKKRKAKAAFKGYCGFPYALCCSVNEQVVHGMPSKKPLLSGDILSIDFGVFYDEYYGDAAVTIAVGDVSDQAVGLITNTEKALDAGISSAVVGGRLFDISYAIQSFVENKGFSVVRDFVGHGIGKCLHEDPQIPNYGVPGTGVSLKSGMVLAIEPMINLGSYDVKVLEDGWTVVTCDGNLSAHFEHTVAITENGPEILTRL